MIFPSLIFFGVAAWYCVQIFRTEKELKNIFWPALFVKCAAGIALGIIYRFHYRVGDTLLFFNDALKLSAFAVENFRTYIAFLFTSDFPTDLYVDLTFIGDERSLRMVKIISVFSLLSFDNYWMITIYVSLLSFFGSWFLVKQLHKHFPSVTGSAVLSFLFFPSIVFWTSGLIKETLAMAALYFASGIFLDLWFGKKISITQWVVTVVAIWLLWGLKYYFAGIFMAVVIASLIYRFASLRIPKIADGIPSYLTWFVMFFALITGVTFLHPNFQAHKLLRVMVQNYEAFHRFSRPDAVIEFENLQPTLSSIIAHSPKALFTGLFRPLFFDATNVLSIFLSVENVVLLVLTLVAIAHAKQIARSNVSILLVAIIVYVILLTLFITLSTPNFGTLARYRVGYLPFFVFLTSLAPPVAIRLQNILVRLSR